MSANTSRPQLPARLWVADEEGAAWHLPQPQQPGRPQRARCGQLLDGEAEGVPSAELLLWDTPRCTRCAAHGRR